MNPTTLVRSDQESPPGDRTNARDAPHTIVTPHSPDRSYAACRRVSRRAGSTFPLAFRLLPAPQRNAMHALYAFCRLTDDLADDGLAIERKRSAFQSWKQQLGDAMNGHYHHDVHPALHDAVQRFTIPSRQLFEIIDGAESDLGAVRFATFDDLVPYCHRVATAVGLACLPIWGVTDPAAVGPATSAGVAFQLTNILRDLGEDLSRDRIYLPQDELARFHCPPETWRERGSAFRELMAFQIDRARRYYRESDALISMIPRVSRGMFQLMTGLYERLLDKIEASGFDVFERRIRVSRWTKAILFAHVWWQS